MPVDSPYLSHWMNQGCISPSIRGLFSTPSTTEPTGFSAMFEPQKRGHSRAPTSRTTCRPRYGWPPAAEVAAVEGMSSFPVLPHLSRHLHGLFFPHLSKKRSSFTKKSPWSFTMEFDRCHGGCPCSSQFSWSVPEVWSGFHLPFSGCLNTLCLHQPTYPTTCLYMECDWENDREILLMCGLLCLYMAINCKYV